MDTCTQHDYWVASFKQITAVITEYVTTCECMRMSKEVVGDCLYKALYSLPSYYAIITHYHS